ncbi:hypothetical protein EVA_06730 [gut metagenome]|uniref:Uncharacterized protein n=1 Tax=gut metagenome TaxID=749906 RepID=J9GWX0_9ZZZZ
MAPFEKIPFVVDPLIFTVPNAGSLVEAQTKRPCASSLPIVARKSMRVPSFKMTRAFTSFAAIAGMESGVLIDFSSSNTPS